MYNQAYTVEDLAKLRALHEGHKTYCAICRLLATIDEMNREIRGVVSGLDSLQKQAGAFLEETTPQESPLVGPRADRISASTNLDHVPDEGTEDGLLRT